MARLPAVPARGHRSVVPTRMSSRTAATLLLLLLPSLHLAACGGGDDPAGPTEATDQTGDLIVYSTTTGEGTPSAPYDVLMDGVKVGSVAPNGNTRINGLPTGEHTVSITVPSHCWSWDGTSQATVIRPTFPVTVQFSDIVCPADGEGL